MANKAGRPKVQYDKARNPGISLRLTVHEEGQIAYAAKVSGLKKSDWARKALLYVATNGIRIT